MKLFVINIILAAIPSLLILLYFYRKESLNKARASLVWKTFALGFLALLPAALIEALVSSVLTGNVLAIIRAFIVAALVEESLKFLVVRLYVYPREEFTGKNSGIMYMIAVSLGFAFFENVLYSFGPPGVIILRGITAVPLHAAASGIMGYFLGKSKVTARGEGVKGFLPGLLIAVFIHGSYNVLLFSQSILSFFVIPLIAGAWIILFRLIRKTRD